MLLLSGQTFAAGAPNANPTVLRFQVIQEAMDFNAENIEKAAIVNLKSGMIGLQIKLKAPFGDELQRLTYKTVGKTANLVYGDRVISSAIIQSPLGYQLLLTGFSSAEAKLFLQSLQTNKIQTYKKQHPPSALNLMKENEPRLIS